MRYHTPPVPNHLCLFCFWGVFLKGIDLVTDFQCVGNIVKGGQSRIVLGKDDIMEREASVGMYKQYCTGLIICALLRKRQRLLSLWLRRLSLFCSYLLRKRQRLLLYVSVCML